jgi:integrase
MARRGNGEGSIYRRKDGRYCGQYTLQTAAGPKRRYVYGKTRKEAAAKLAQAMAQASKGLTLDAGAMTVSELIADWLAAHANSVKPHTASQYQRAARLHILPGIGKMKVARLTAAHVQRLYNALGSEKGLSPSSVRGVHAVLHSALDHAVRQGLIGSNPADAVKVPRKGRSRPEMNPLSSDEVGQLFEAARGDRLEALYVVAVCTGARLGELLALKWADVDLDARTMRIERTLITAKGGWQFGSPKSGRGRTVNLSRMATEALRHHRAYQAEERLEMGSLWHDHGLIFTDEVGKPLSPQSVLRTHFYALLRKANLPRVRFHDLRHTCATLLFERNMHPKVVSEMLGHANIGITLEDAALG